ncbi:MAG: HAD family hydrolase [Muricomes sp.]
MERAALFFDIDGTLLDETTKKIPQSAMDAMSAAREAGHLLFINTGRTMCSIPAELKRFKFDGYLCGCGTYLTYHDEVLFEKCIPEARGREIIDKMIECKLEGLFEGVEDAYMSSRMSRFDRLESTRRYFNELGLGRELYIETGKFVYDKLFVYVDEQSDKETFFQFIEKDIEPIDRGGNTYECVQRGYSKATACEFIRQKFDMDINQIYVFGDSTNDISMFQYARHSIAMEVHAEELAPYTEYVTSKLEEDGIAHAIYHYGLA